MVIEINFNPLSIEAIFTACLLSFLSTLILSRNRKLEQVGRNKNPLLVLSYLLNIASYFFLARINVFMVIIWYLIVGLPTFYLYYTMFLCLKNELKEKWER
ncbi:MAG: hypothetical protein QXL77_06570 [Candidatus Bathyarchaeia archaeon]